MPIRNWLPNAPLGAGLAIICMLAIAGLLHQGGSKHHEDTQSRKQTPAEAHRHAEDDITAIVEPPNPDPHPNRSEWREEQDLEAQRDMAEWAGFAAIAAAFSVAVSFIGIYLVKRTLDATREAVRETAEGARAARRQADLAEEAYRRLERPFVFLEIINPGIEMLSDGQMRFAGHRFAFQFTNYGRAPALIHELKESYPVVEGLADAPPPLDPRIDRGRMQPNGTVSAAGAPYKLSAYLPNVSDVAPMLEADAWSSRRIFFQGFIRFSDPFGVHYITGFLACFSAPGGGWALRGGSEHNYARMEKPEDIPPDPY